ncbi:MAG TPA: PEP-CTERM sorting domain-containing protein [Pirellulales bacterium]|jgi:hypothetical protein
MNATVKKSLFVIFRCALALFLLLTARGASALTLTIDSSQSSLQFGFSLVSMDTGDLIGAFVGQGDVPQGTMKAGNGLRYPGYSNGLAAQLTGTINVTPGGFSITGGSNVHLLNSGSWQPGVPIGLSRPTFQPDPVPSELGAYLATSLLQNGALDTFIAARTYNDLLDFASSGPLTLGPGGAFDDPEALATIVSGNVALSAYNPLTTLYTANSNLTTHPDSGAFDMTGSFFQGQLKFETAATVLLDETDLFDGLPVGLLITVNGSVVTQQVPEPSSMWLLMAGGVTGLISFLQIQIRRR